MIDFFAGFQLAALLFFLLVFIGRSLYLYWRKGVRAFVLGANKQGVQRVMEIAFFIGLVIWMAEIVRHTLPLQGQIFPSVFYVRLIDSFPAKIGGMILIIAGFSIFILALASFGDSWRIGIDKQSPGDLVTAGIFSLSRNPIFVFVGLYFWGTFLLSGTWVFLFFALLVTGGLHYQILQEEKFLRKTYGQTYQNYCHHTARYLVLF